ncbi:hypothetical protein BDZ85DRAFT_251208 [Elsinoe ampelina]|uniref:Uncharacterized protein n=1 Tax=Elsinoe ampelina TaxID=302913 RepID=A0A6A6G6S5_9PEZI|nr:hypothetical protein BDZ85DRAFT_251208 [Elsinoe ampelina]
MRWINAADVPPLGTTYLYVDPDSESTSTSVTCDTSLFMEYKTKLFSPGFYDTYGTIDDNCSITLPYRGREWTAVRSTNATWPGPEWLFDVGDEIAWEGAWVTGSSLEMIERGTSTLPAAPQWYTWNDVYYTRGVVSGVDKLAGGYVMPGLSKMYPDLSILSSCTLVQWATNPNTLRYAHFLTETRTSPRTASGHLTTLPIPESVQTTTVAPVPVPQPTQPHASPSQSQAQVGPAPSPTSSPRPVITPAQPGRPLVPTGTASPASSRPSNTGSNNLAKQEANDPANPVAANAIPNAAPPRITSAPALVVPASNGALQTLRPGSSPVTVSGHIISLDTSSVAHVVSPSTQQGRAPETVAISLDDIARVGAIQVQGTRIAAFGIMTYEEVQVDGTGEGGAGSTTGGAQGSGGIGTVADRVGGRVSGIGAWIRSGLGIARVGGGGGGSVGGAGARGNSTSGSGAMAFTGKGGRRRVGMVSIAMIVAAIGWTFASRSAYPHQPKSFKNNTTADMAEIPHPVCTSSRDACDLFLKPLWNQWTTAAANFSAVGTTYLYIDPNVNTTSTSVTCTPSVLSQVPDQYGRPYGNRFPVTIDDECNFYVSVLAPAGRGNSLTAMSYDQGKTQLDIGPVVTFQYYGGTRTDIGGYEAWRWSTWFPAGPQPYTGVVSQSTKLKPDGSIDETFWHMPDLSIMYPDIPDLTSCKGIHMETTPNQLTAARFLTEYITLPKAVAGGLTVPPMGQPSAAPVPRPNNPAPTASSSPIGGSEAGASVKEPSVGQGSSPTSSGGQGQPAAPGGSSPADGVVVPGQNGGSNTGGSGGSNAGGANNADGAGRPASGGPSPPRTTVPALILPDRQTLRAGAPASTVSGHVISLGQDGLVHVRPAEEDSSTPGSQSPEVVLSLPQIAAAGGIEVDGVKIPAFGTVVVETTSGEQVSVGQSGSPQSPDAGGEIAPTPGSRVGQAISGIGAWVMSGLGASGSKNTQTSGPSGNPSSRPGSNSTIVPFTGAASRPVAALAALGSALFVVICIL